MKLKLNFHSTLKIFSLLKNMLPDMKYFKTHVFYMQNLFQCDGHIMTWKEKLI